MSLCPVGRVFHGNDFLTAANANANANAIAIAHGTDLVTHNTAEFGRVPGLKMEDWEV